MNNGSLYDYLNSTDRAARYLVVNTVETLISAAALIDFSRNFCPDLLSKMRLLIELRLLFEDGTY